MNKAVLNSSALIAFINQENGYELAEEYLPNAIMSSVNISEVVAVLSLVDIPEATITGIINDLNIEVINFDKEGDEEQTII
jgi:PIN domain nuclease of toxin-antitoxin system